MAVSNVYNPPDGSFVKATRKAGTGLHTPTEGAECRIIVTLANQESDTHLDLGLPTGEETSVVIGEGDTDVREVIDKCLLTMRKDEISGVLFPVVDGCVVRSAQAADATFVTLEIHLTHFESELLSDLEPLSKLQKAQQHKERGTELFKFGQREAAFRRYSRAMCYLVSAASGRTGLAADLLADIDTLRTQVHLNLAACQLHYDHYAAVVTNCSRALEVDPRNIKGLYRRGVAYSRQKDWERAAADLGVVLELDPRNKAALRELHTVDQMLREEREQEKLGQLARGMRQMFS